MRAVRSRRSEWCCTLLLVLLLAACSDGGGVSEPLMPDDQLRVMTFNVGIPDCSNDPDAAYSCEDAEIAGEWYGTGLSHRALFADTAAFFRATRPDIVGLQEVFHAGNCPEIPPEFHPGFICEDWRPGDSTVSQIVLGADYQIACHQGRPDKCLAVHCEVGRFAPRERVDGGRGRARLLHVPRLRERHARPGGRWPRCS